MAPQEPIHTTHRTLGSAFRGPGVTSTKWKTWGGGAPRSNSKIKLKIKIKVKGRGQECPRHICQPWGWMKWIRRKVAAATMAEAGIVRIQAQTMRPATPQRTADKRCKEPTPTMAPVMVWVVLTGMPARA